jgi:triacylglycerol lipase
MTIRSDNNDKFAQPDGVWIGAKGTPTNVTAADGPSSRAPRTSCCPASTTARPRTGRGLRGRLPLRHRPRSDDAGDRIAGAGVLDGKITGLGLGNDPSKGSFSTNLPLAGATVEVYATDPATGERRGNPLWRKTTGADGRWGPLQADSRASLEFVIAAPGYATTHIYRSPFARSSNLVHLRAERLAEADKDAGAVVTLSRPRGYFGVPRDRIELDGQSPPPGIPTGVAGVASSRIKLPAGPLRAVAGAFNGERIVGRNWPAAEGRVVILELHH